MRLISLVALLTGWLICIGLARGQDAAGKVALKPFFPPGNYVMKTVTHTERELTGRAKAKTTIEDQTLVWDLNVSAPTSKGEKKIVATLRKIEFHQTQDKTTHDYDSANPAAKQDENLAFVFKAALGAQATISFNADNTVVEASGLDKIWDDLGSKTIAFAQKTAIAQGRQSLNDKLMQQDFSSDVLIFPKNPVAAGDTWNADVTMDVPVVGDVKAHVDCKFQEVQKSPSGDVAVITSDKQYSITEPKVIQMVGLPPFTIAKYEGKEKSTLQTDLKTGLLAHEETSWDINQVLQGKNPVGKAVEGKSHTIGKGQRTIEAGSVPSTAPTHR